MELSEIVEFARKFSVMVKINGPDPKGMKMRNHAFHQYHSGKTTLSASGLLLPRNLREAVNYGSCENGAVVVTVASIIEPFLSQKSKMISAQGIPELIPGAQIDVMVELKEGMEQNPVSLDDGGSKWFNARILRLVDVPTSSSAIRSLIEASSGLPEQCWEVGWSLSARVDSTHNFMDSEAKSKVGLMDVNLIGKAATRIAFLLLPSLLEDLPEIKISHTNKRGDFLLSMGSPFGILSPLHFFNSISVGSVANCYPSVSLDKSLLMADIRCLPGMEGGPVFGEHACLVGILNRPLRQTGGAEIQVVIPWTAIEGAFADLFHSDYPEAERRMHYVGKFSDARTVELKSVNSQAPFDFIESRPVSCSAAPLAVQKAMSSVCLITLDNGVWASGVLLNKEGLILTNAHLLEPWRFGRTTMQGAPAETNVKNMFTLLEDSMPPTLVGENKSQVMQPNALEPQDYLGKNSDFHTFHQVQSQISVRVDLVNSWLWCNAKVVYVSKGPLDVSLLQLESVPQQLCPIRVDLASPSLGSKAFVIGHGLLGPRCDLLPSISSGVVAKVVKAKVVVSHRPALQRSHAREVPVMLETTASVYPGSSGGAVVNASGLMIALVTSNAKHGGGTLIPHMNFSIPSGALEPLFIFSKDMQDMTLLQQLDRPNPELASVWAMMPKISPEPDPSLHGVNEFLGKDKEHHGKGTQFAKFMNERQELLRKSRPHDPTQGLTRDTIPSKL